MQTLLRDCGKFLLDIIRLLSYRGASFFPFFYSFLKYIVIRGNGNPPFNNPVSAKGM